MRPSIASLLPDSKVIPVLVIENEEDALPLAHCLVDNGLPVLEITLRSDAALKSIETIASQVEGAVVGVGSILTEAQLNASQSAGGQFGVSPGVSFKLLQALELSDWPFLPGAGSLSEMLTLRDAGFMQQKLFPAAVLGGVVHAQGRCWPGQRHFLLPDRWREARECQRVPVALQRFLPLAARGLPRWIWCVPKIGTKSVAARQKLPNSAPEPFKEPNDTQKGRPRQGFGPFLFSRPAAAHTISLSKQFHRVDCIWTGITALPRFDAPHFVCPCRRRG